MKGAQRWFSPLGLVLLNWLCAGCDANPSAPRPSSAPEQRSAAPDGSAQSPQATASQELSAQPSSGETGRREPLNVSRARHAIVKLHLEQARQLLASEVGPEAAAVRARLAIYQADCEGAQALLARGSVRTSGETAELRELADRCVGATAGGVIVADAKQGVWLRIQDAKDTVLAPLIIDVAARAREALERDLGETLPRPLRIDLVRDLFSLSAVSGLPLDAAETTGTVAVARWGRVTMVSPRAMQSGFPWADTLAHEITHLLISRATAERAPLWLQEGIAKREEKRWRAPELFDDALDLSRRAHDAQLAGKSVGVDKIGPSIAMLPSAEAASIAFAEVTSFMEYWIERNGPRSLEFLLRDMEVAPSAESAMQSVSGFSVQDWQLLWRENLSERFLSAPTSEESEVLDEAGPRQLGRVLRLVELLTVDGRAGAAELRGGIEVERSPHVAALRFLAARAAYLNGSEEADSLLGQPSDVDSAHAGYLALSGYRLERLLASDPLAEQMRSQARTLDPLLAEAACGGRPWVGEVPTPGVTDAAPGKADPPAKSEDLADPLTNDPLCRAARALPVRGSR